MNLVQNLTLNSLEVAKIINKVHAHLLRDIETYQSYLGESNFGFTEFWQESTYKTKQNKTLKCYLITKKGCEFLAHKMTGKKGTLFTAAYINRFHEMEAALQKQSTPAIQPAEEKITIKRYQGKPVMTTRDLAPILGVQSWNVFAAMKRWCVENADYMLLTGEALRKFKEENKGVVSRVLSVLIVITESGIRKLCNVYRKAFPKELIQTAAPAPVRSKDKMMKEIDAICTKMKAIESVLRHYPETVLKGAKKNAILQTAQDMGMAVSVDIIYFSRRYDAIENNK